MRLPFLDDKAERELVHRIQRAREPEEERYRERKSAIMAEFCGRGMDRSSAHYCASRDEEVKHLRNIASIAREGLFQIIEAKEIRLTDSDVKAISGYIAENFKRGVGFVEQSLIGIVPQTELMPRNDRAFEMQIEQAVQHEAVVEVEVRATELRRRLGKERSTRWSDRVEKFAWMVGCVILGILGTLATQWLAK